MQISPYITLTQLQKTSRHAHHLNQQVPYSKSQAKFILQHSLYKEDQLMMFQAKTSHRPYETPTLYPSAWSLQKVPT